MSGLVLSIFPGIGLMDRAFEQEGFTVVRGPDVLWGGDIRTFHPPEGRFDGVIGGPPCQSFSSLAHLVRASGREPKFGNLIPEFERCVRETLPLWFVMENVPQAPLPVVTGYGVHSFLLDNSHLDDGTGWGQEQRRVRRFSFGLNADRTPPNLLLWVDLAVFVLPDADGPTVTQWTPDNTPEAKRRRAAEDGSTRETPVKLGGSGKPTRTLAPPPPAGHEQPAGLTERQRLRRKAVSGSNGGAGAQRLSPGAGNNGRGRVRYADACRLQGLPEDFLADAPFTAEGKLKAVANGVPLPMGIAIARAVKEALR